MASATSNDKNGTTSASPANFVQALRFWLKLGFISFGGPAGQISIMHQELVEKRRWISERRFLHALNYCMVLPGPEAQQLATYIGWLMHKTWGGIVAGGLFVLPSLLILIALSWVYIAFGQTPAISGLFYGIKPAVIAIVIYATYRIGYRALKNSAMWMIAAASFIAIFMFNTPFPVIVLAAALTGYAAGQIMPETFKTTHDDKHIHKTSAPAFIDDDTLAPAHTQLHWRRLALTAFFGLLFWLAPAGILLTLYDWHHTLTQMAWFFTKAALLTFGGAYAVLPYVYQGAVGYYHWLTPGQMIDGLALGETTPGPLIMVVTFVGFVGGYTEAFFGPDAPVVAGIVAAVLVTWFTFLPSFLFILIGAPFVESTRHKIRFTAPLTAITAAVVGVILNLALFFSYHVLWPQGLENTPDWTSLGIAAAALAALLCFKLSIIKVLALCAGTGLVLHLL